MNRLLTIEPMPRTICTQPDCMLRRPTLTKESIAKIVIHAISGEPMDALISPSERVEMRSQCMLCAMRVLDGGKAYLSESEWQYLDDMGDWHTRRHRRHH